MCGPSPKRTMPFFCAPSTGVMATPVTTGELLVAKMLGALLPTSAISLAGLGLYLGGIVATAAPGVAAAMLSLRTATLAISYEPPLRG